MIELEKTYLAKYLPKNLENCESREIIDHYVPKDSNHAVLRIRKNGRKYEITKKQPTNEGDASSQFEQTIPLTQEEYNSLTQQLESKKVRKLRYYFNYNEQIAEFDVFQDKLSGLVLVDFEFNTENEKNLFEIPEFCLEDITQESFIAGGEISGKSYEDIENNLDRFNYKKLYLKNVN